MSSPTSKKQPDRRDSQTKPDEGEEIGVDDPNAVKRRKPLPAPEILDPALPVIKPTLEVFIKDKLEDRPARIDILAHNHYFLYQFMGYVLDQAGELNKIYDILCQDVLAENKRRQEEYQLKLKEMRETGNFNTKIELPPDDELPPKIFEKMFEAYLNQHEMTLTDEFRIRLFDRDYILQYRGLDKVTPDRIRTLPDCVIFLIEGKEEDFRKQFTECSELKQALFMHIFFGTQKIFFCPYYSYRDRLLRHLDYQIPFQSIIEKEMNYIFQYIKDEFYGDCSRVKIISTCVKLRTDNPNATMKMMHINKAAQLLHSEDAFVKAKDRDIVWFDLGFLQEVYTFKTFGSAATSRPLRFMVFESYIMGGVGTYVVGEVLSGAIRPETVLLGTPGELRCEIAFLDKDRKMVEQATLGERIGVSIPNLNCKQIPRGTVLSEIAHTPAKDIEFALGFFLTVNYKGDLRSGMKLHLVNNRISRVCKIEVDSLIRMDKECIIDRLDSNTVPSKEIVFLRIIPSEPLVLDDPVEFPEFTMAQLWDNCQTVAIGKIFKLFKKGETRAPSTRKSSNKTLKNKLEVTTSPKLQPNALNTLNSPMNGPSRGNIQLPISGMNTPMTGARDLGSNKFATSTVK